MELTKEHFDQVVSGLATKQDLERLATTEDIEELASMVQRGFADLSDRLDVHKQLDEHDRDIRILKHALELR